MEHTKAYQEFKKNGNTKFVRYSEGAEMYHMSVSKFMQKVQWHAFFICSVASQKKVLAKNIRKTSANGSVQRGNDRQI